MNTLDLSKDWRLRQESLAEPLENGPAIAEKKTDWLTLNLPADVRMPLIEAGIIKDPVLADYAQESEWVEKRSWWFKKTFHVTQEDLSAQAIELFIEAIDTKADIWINNIYLGHHQNVHRPFCCPLQDRLLKGENTLLIRVTTGLEDVSDQMLSDLDWAVCHEKNNGAPDRGDYRRAFVRRPQYSVGWDWGPRVVTCGLVGKVEINFAHAFKIHDVQLETVSIAPSASIKGTVTLDFLNIISTGECDLEVSLSLNGDLATEYKESRVLLTSGLNYLDFTLEIDQPQLWWPNGYGQQPLYEVHVQIKGENQVCSYPVFKYGIRQIKLDTSSIDEKNRHFCLLVNQVPIFCKGGNWIPADSIYARVSPEKYKILIQEAKDAHFSMLRIWGGGLFEQNIFYDLCDEMGILIWQDLMFGCSAYPDHLPWFKEESRLEIDYQTKRLRNRACLALFCGNNENHWIYNQIDNPQWGIKLTLAKQYGLEISNSLAKEVTRLNCPYIPYWNSSPYGGEQPNDDSVGDVHRWPEAMMNPDMAVRIDPRRFDGIKSKFVSEYGYPGPCDLASIQEYYDHKPIVRGDKVWELHNNTFEKKTVNAGIEKHYLDDASHLSLEDYLLYAGMVQCHMLEYTLEALRFEKHCSGALFWMYNDTWGEVGWTIIDYYLKRKPSYYGVKRAFAPLKCTLRQTGSALILQAINDSEKEVTIKGKVGYLTFDGQNNHLEAIELTVPAHFRGEIYQTDLRAEDYTLGSMAFLSETAGVDSFYWHQKDMKELNFANPLPEIKVLRQEGDNVILSLYSPVYIHGIHVIENFLCSDNYFDLLPDQTKEIVVYNAKHEDVKITQILVKKAR